MDCKFGDIIIFKKPHISTKYIYKRIFGKEFAFKSRHKFKRVQVIDKIEIRDSNKCYYQLTCLDSDKSLLISNNEIENNIKKIIKMYEL